MMHHQGVELYNVAEIVPQEGGGFKMCRIPLRLREQINPSAQSRCMETTGCELRFNLASPEAEITLRMDDRPAVAELWHGPFMDRDWFVVGLEPTTLKTVGHKRPEAVAAIAERGPLAYDPALYRIVLPWRPQVTVLGLEGEFVPPRPGQTPTTRYLAYGSSITHGNTSIRPSATYASRTAQRLGVDLINLGFGGGAHLEPEMADYIAGRDDWDFATLELGVNIIKKVTVEEFAERVDYFVSTISTRHPDKWVFCMDLFPMWADYGEDRRRARGFRKVVRDAVGRLDQPRLVHLDGRRLLKDLSNLTGDVVHLAPAGMEEVSANLARAIKARTGLGAA